MRMNKKSYNFLNIMEKSIGKEASRILRSYARSSKGKGFGLNNPTLEKYAKVLERIHISFDNSFSAKVMIGIERYARMYNVKWKIMNIHDKGIKKPYKIRPVNSKYLVFEVGNHIPSKNPNPVHSFVKMINGKKILFTKEVYRTPKEGFDVGRKIIPFVEKIFNEFILAEFKANIEEVLYDKL